MKGTLVPAPYRAMVGADGAELRVWLEVLGLTEEKLGRISRLSLMESRSGCLRHGSGWNPKRQAKDCSRADSVWPELRKFTICVPQDEPAGGSLQ